MPRTRHLTSALLALLGAVSFSMPLGGCGGGGGGAGPTGPGQGLVLVSFVQESLDNVSLNQSLEFRFSEAPDPNTINGNSIQIREGSSFGLQVPGEFKINGSTVIFEPRLPGLCDLSDAGLKPDTQYRVQIVGSPEFNQITNVGGEPLPQTLTMEFSTRGETDPLKLIDQIPATQPKVLSMSPADGSDAVAVADGNVVELVISENLDPCTVGLASVLFEIHETGDPNVANTVISPNSNNPSGFYTGTDTTDQTGDPTTWGADVSTTVAPAQVVPATVNLVQDFASTRIIIRPLFGSFPDNALIVVRVLSTVQDFAGQPIEPFVASFTTENQAPQQGQYVLENAGETPYSISSTADVNTARSPSLVQGYLLVTGDGDNGATQLLPNAPETPGSGCTTPRQVNDGTLDDFDPAGDVLLDTGALNTCTNTADGSTAVVWEFNSFRIRTGRTVRIVGGNPAIILVKGAAVIESGAVLRVAGDGAGGAPAGIGQSGNGGSGVTDPQARNGGVGVAGGGDGGDSNASVATHGDPGFSGFGSPSGQGASGGDGAGNPGVNVSDANFTTGANGHGGGGGAHSEIGSDGSTLGAVGLLGAVDSAGSTDVYGQERLFVPSAGSGGGSGGYAHQTNTTNSSASGAGGGAGGGFVDITARTGIDVFGTIDAAGRRGGNGGSAGFYKGSGGGGGGSGGAIRLLTPGEINLTGGVLSTAGGAGGAGGVPTATSGTLNINPGGAGGAGRVVLEDSDTVITGFATASIVPSEGSDGFYRGSFDVARFAGGGLRPDATTEIFSVGPINPNFVAPTAGDFIVGVPALSSPGIGNEVILVEAEGYQINPDGTPNLATASGFRYVGYFSDSGVEGAPNWNLGTPPSVTPATRPTDNNGDVFGDSLTTLNGAEFLRVRFTIVLRNGVGPFDPGSFVDRWNIRFGFDN